VVFGAVGLFGPWGEGSLTSLLWDPTALGPGLALTSLWLLRVAAILGFLAILASAACAALSPREAPPAGALAVGLAGLALAALFGLPQAGVASPMDGLHRSIAGLPFAALVAALAGALTAVSEDPAALLRRQVAGALWLALAGMLLCPVYPGANPILPLVALARPAEAGVAGILVGFGTVAVGALGAAAVLHRPSAALLRALAGVALLLAPAWQLAATGMPAPAALTLGLGLAVAMGTRDALTVAATGLERWSPWARDRLPAIAEALAIGTVVALWFLLKTHGLRPSATDENIYFYQALRLSEGVLPYRDFFFAHPILHLVVPALLFAVFGFDVVWAKLIAPAAALGAGVFVLLIARRAMGRAAGVLALVAFLFSAEILKASTNLTGVNLTLLGVSAGTWALLRDRPRLSGAMFGLAASTGFYAMGGFAVLLAAALFGGRRRALGLAVGFAAVFGAIALVSLAVGGDGYVDGVYRYHALKPGRVEGQVPLFGPGGMGPFAPLVNLAALMKTSTFQGNLYYQGLLWWGALLSVVPLLALPWVTGERVTTVGQWARRVLDPRRLWDGDAQAQARLLFLVALGYFLELGMLRELHDYYFVLPFPALAVLFAFTSYALASLLADAARALLHGRGMPAAGGLAIALVALLLLTGPIRQRANFTAWPDEAKSVGGRVDFEYSDPPMLAGLSGVVHALFWRDHRIKGQLLPGYVHYLWSKKRWFSTAEDIARHVRDNSPEDATLTGSSAVAPLIAILSGRRMAADEADTNTKRWKTGLLTVPGFQRTICDTKLAFVVGTRSSFFSPQRLQQDPFYKRWFSRDRVWDDSALRNGGSQRIVLLRRKGDLGQAPPVCEPTGE
jgi:hypothetical protein